MEAIVAHHYAMFEAYGLKKIPNERLYAEVLNTYGRMEAVGFERFKPYNTAALLWHLGQFMYKLGDLERMHKYLHAAEPFLAYTERDHLHTILVLNHLQTYHQKKKEYAKAIEYAQKILNFSRELHPNDPSIQRRLRFWEGLSLLDIASMRVEQGYLSEGERYADEGYRLSVADHTNQALEGVRGEYDALQVLLTVKLKTGKLDEADALIRRAEVLQKTLNTDPNLENYYFAPLKFYNNCAQYHALRGDAASALRFTNLARALQDSLGRRNDARKYEQIQQRHEAEKYTTKLRMVEQEKQMQTLLRNAALLILLLTLALAWVNYRRLQAKRQQALTELEAAKREIENSAHAFREKSEIAENLRLEMESLASRGERSQILTNFALNGTTSNWTTPGGVTTGTSCSALVPVAFSACPTGETVNTVTGTCAAPASYAATANADINYLFTGATTGSGAGTGSGSTFNRGTTTVTLTATNACASTATCQFSVQVSDAEAPAITCPATANLNTNNNLCTSTASIGTASATDNCTITLNNALHFDGGNDYAAATVPGTFLGSNPLTIEFWAKNNSAFAFPMDLGFTWQVQFGNGTFYLSGFGLGAFNTGATVSNSGTVWEHFALTYDGAGTWKAYKNGLPTPTPSCTMAVCFNNYSSTLTNPTLRMGTGNNNYFYAGGLDEATTPASPPPPRRPATTRRSTI